MVRILQRPNPRRLTFRLEFGPLIVAFLHPLVRYSYVMAEEILVLGLIGMAEAVSFVV